VRRLCPIRNASLNSYIACAGGRALTPASHRWSATA
jgi:hypothetical protein